MTVKIEYSCDLCADDITTERELARGIYWIYNKDLDRHVIVFRPMHDVAHHLCGNCLYDLGHGPVESQK